MARTQTLITAILAAGSAKALALGLGITPASLGRWQKIPIERAMDVERITAGRVTLEMIAAEYRQEAIGGTMKPFSQRLDADAGEAERRLLTALRGVPGMALEILYGDDDSESLALQEITIRDLRGALSCYFQSTHPAIALEIERIFP